jgi:hypothetical protein
MQRQKYAISRRTLVVAFASLASSPISAATDTTSAKSIAVISAIGHRLSEKTTGLTVFSNSEQKLEISDWKIDDYVIEYATDFLKAKGYGVSQISYDWHDFDTHGGGLFGDDISAAIPKIVRKLAVSDGPDLYLVISRFANTYHVDGLEVSRASVFGHTAATIGVSFAISLIDGHSFKNIDTEASFIPASGTLFGRSSPGKMIDDKDWPESFADLTQTQLNDIRDSLKGLITEALAFSLPRIDYPK